MDVRVTAKRRQSEVSRKREPRDDAQQRRALKGAPTGSVGSDGRKSAGRAAIPAAPVHVEDPSALHVASTDSVRSGTTQVRRATPRCWVGIF